MNSAAAAPGDHPYIALGDSITVGYPWGPSTPANSYASLLYNDYTSSLGADELLNRAETGESAASLRSGGQLTTALADINAPSDTVAATLGIAIGSNALSSPCNGHWDAPSICQYRADFAYIASQLRAALDLDPGSEPFTVLAYYNNYSGTGGEQEASGDRLLLGDDLSISCADVGADVGLNDVIFQEAGALGLPVANSYPPIKAAGQADIDSDHVHPNDAGHAAIAQAFRDSVNLCPEGRTPPPADTTAPQTTITKAKISQTKRKSKFSFSSNEAASTFSCTLHKKPFRSCTSPKSHRKLNPGKYKFKVRATDTAGNTDPTPAVKEFKIKR